MERFPAAAPFLCAIIAIVGVGSVTFHTVATRWAEWADVTPILIFMLVFCWAVLSAFSPLANMAQGAGYAASPRIDVLSGSGSVREILMGRRDVFADARLLIFIGAGIWRKESASAGESVRFRCGAFRPVLRGENRRHADVSFHPLRRSLSLARP